VQGNVDAQYNMALMYSGGHGLPQDSKKEVEWFAKAAAQGNVNSEFFLGYCTVKATGYSEMTRRQQSGLPKQRSMATQELSLS